MRKIAWQVDIAQNIGVGQSEVGVKQDDLLSRRRKLNGQINGNIALANAALSAGNGNDGGPPMLLYERPQMGGLVN
jgi:hypothetical protein